MPDTETVSKADAAFIDARPKTTVDFETLAVTCAAVIQKAADAETLTDADRDAVRRAHFAMRSTPDAPADAEGIEVDSELWDLVKADAEGVDLGAAPPSATIETLRKAWTAEPAAPVADEPPPVADEPPTVDLKKTDAPAPVSAEVASLYAAGDVNDLISD